MKQFTSITKKSLSLILALILLTACAAVPAWALVDPVAPTLGTVTDKSIVARCIDVPAGIEYQFCAIPSTTTISTDILNSAIWAGETANETSTATLKADFSGSPITPSTSYKVFSRAYETASSEYYVAVEAFTTAITLAAAPAAPTADVVTVVADSITYSAVTFNITNPLTSLEYSYDNGTNWAAVPEQAQLTVSGLVHSTSYIFYFRYKSANGQATSTYPDGVLAVSAKTKTKEPWTPAPSAPLLSGYRSDSEIGIVFVSDDYIYCVNGVEKAFVKRLNTANEPVIVITGLAAGTTYRITCIKRADAEHSNSAPSAEVLAATKIVPGVPVGQSTRSITDTEISMTYSPNVAYACVPFGEAAPATGWKAGSVSSDNVVSNATFTGLTPGAKYGIYYKYLETANQIEGVVSPSPLSITTKLAASAAPASNVAPVIIDKSVNAIKVQEVAGVEFCIALLNGNNTTYSNWQTSGTFSNLNANANYSIKARYVCDTAVQMPGNESIQSAYTTSRVGYAASIGNCKVFSTAEVIRANGSFSVTATGDRPAATLGALVYGDTRIVPIGVYTNQDTTVKPINANKENTCTFPVTPTATGKLTVTVVFASEKYKGLDASGNPVWENIGNINDYATFTVKDQQSGWTNFLDGLVKVINVFTNIIPKIILAISEMFGKAK